VIAGEDSDARAAAQVVLTARPWSGCLMKEQENDRCASLRLRRVKNA
jgi:hypothetical protein